jgi:hypothetical protein
VFLNINLSNKFVIPILWNNIKNRLVVVKGKTLKPFWKNKKGGIQFGYRDFGKFCGSLGFVISDNGIVMKIISSNNSIYPVYSWESIHGYITSFLTNTNPEHFEGGEKFGIPLEKGSDETWDQDDILDHWMVKGEQISRSMFTNRQMLPKFKMSQIFRDSDKECYLNFKNGIVKITKDKIEMLKDTSVIGNKYRRTSDFIHKLDTHTSSGFSGNIEVDDSTDGEFEIFTKTATSLKVNELSEYEKGEPRYGKEYIFNGDGHKSLMSGIGYLIHGKSLGGISKMVLFQDRYINGLTREGGNGKSIVLKGIDKVVKLYEEDGGSMIPNNPFRYQGCNLGDRVLFLEELRPRRGPTSGGIQINDLFNDITSSFKYEKKNQGKVTLTGDDVPKLVGCSNFIVFDKDDSSTMRRIHIVEFSDLGKYHEGSINRGWDSDKKLLGYEGHWKKKDWNDFYNFMFRCVQLWLNSKPDFDTDPNPQWKTSSQLPKWVGRYGRKEVGWGIDYIKVQRTKMNHHLLKDGKSDKTNGTLCFSHELYRSFKEICPDSFIDETDMKKMLFDLCKDLGYEYNPTQKGNGDSPNKRKLQRTFFIDELSCGQKQVIHITHPSD